jgi:hypothetical protein
MKMALPPHFVRELAEDAVGPRRAASSVGARAALCKVRALENVQELGNTID